MKKIISFILKPPANFSSKEIFRIAIIDMLTIGIGFTILMHTAFENGNRNESGATFGGLLLISGILIRLWRRDFNGK